MAASVETMAGARRVGFNFLTPQVLLPKMLRAHSLKEETSRIPGVSVALRVQNTYAQKNQKQHSTSVSCRFFRCGVLWTILVMLLPSIQEWCLHKIRSRSCRCSLRTDAPTQFLPCPCKDKSEVQGVVSQNGTSRKRGICLM